MKPPRDMKASPVPPLVAGAEEPASARPRFPMHRAFVVHLGEGAEPAMDALAGRVEHLVSGRTARFDDVASLVKFFRDAFARSEEGE